MTSDTTQNTTDTPAAGWAGAELRMLDPASLLLDRNPRQLGDIHTARPDLVDSVTHYGLLHPTLADQEADGVHVRDGHCRAMAAIAAGRDRVPVIVDATSDGGAMKVAGAVILDDKPKPEATMPVCRDEALDAVAGWSVTTVHLPGEAPAPAAASGEYPAAGLDDEDPGEVDDAEDPAGRGEAAEPEVT
jgi:hypothetical protein